jgi:hypothetical protein
MAKIGVVAARGIKIEAIEGPDDEEISIDGSDFMCFRAGKAEEDDVEAEGNR